MRKCESCGAEATVHVTEAHVTGEEQRTVTRHLCEACAQEALGESPPVAGSADPFEGLDPDELVAAVRRVADSARAGARRIAPEMYDQFSKLTEGQFRPSREEWIAAYIQRNDHYWDTIVAFVEKHKRMPDDDELDDLFKEW